MISCSLSTCRGFDLRHISEAFRALNVLLRLGFVCVVYSARSSELDSYLEGQWLENC